MPPHALTLRLSGLAVALLLTGAGCAGGGGAGRGGGRYYLARDEGSRYDFRYVRDRETGQWIQRDCELRVAMARDLPSPIVHPEYGNLMSIDLLKPQSIEGAGFRSLEPARRDGYYLWQIPQVLGEYDLAGEVDYGVQIKWPDTGGPARFEPLEIITPPPIAGEPGVWSPWVRAGRVRAGGFGAIEEVNRQASPPAEMPAHPFELRCRLVLTDIPGFVP